jgi:hypothetical protein
VWRGELDIDDYELSHDEVMERISKHSLPWMVNRTKSGGLRIILFFSEPIEAALVQDGMKVLAAQLGFAKCEIFPKQTQVLNEDDYPGWTFLPYGPTFDHFVEQYGLTHNANGMTLLEYVTRAEQKHISKEKFINAIQIENRIKTEARAGAKKHGNGRWVQEESLEATIRATFCDGPPCLWDIARQGSSVFQHNHLFNCAVFFKNKYPDNWKEPLQWVNDQLLRPVGNTDKLKDLMRSMDNTKKYTHKCQEEPICSHCNPYACRRMRYGVGNGQAQMDHYELGLTIVTSQPYRFTVNIGDTRAPCSAADLLNVHKFRELCMKYSGEFPDKQAQKDWDQVLRRSIETATYIEPSDLYKTNAEEIELLARYFSIHIPNMVRGKGNEYLAGKCGDVVRVRMKDERIYFKFEKLEFWVSKFKPKMMDAMRSFVNEHCIKIARERMRDWFRSSYAIGFDSFDKAVVHMWLNPDEPDDEGEEEDSVDVTQSEQVGAPADAGPKSK